MAVGIYFIIMLIVEIILYSFHLSLFVLLFVKRRSDYNGPFYTIFRIVILADFFNFLLICLYQRFPLVPFLTPFFYDNATFAAISYSFAPLILVTMFLGHTLMSFNRFTLIWFPFKYQQIWKKPWYIVLMIVISLLNICYRLHQPVTFVHLPDGIVNPVYKDPALSSFQLLLTSSIFFVTTCFAACFNLLSFLKFYFNKSVAVNVNEKHLLYVSLITFIAQLLRTSFTVAMFLFAPNTELANFCLAALPHLNNFFALSGSISFFILSSSPRKAYKQFYFCKTDSSIHILSSNQKIFIKNNT